uniref:Uncharacterized protein n=1 Tax=Mandrillus leucophaeus TaxID=9568 RepID=A0A2K5ZFH8_MANLE
MSTRLMAPGHFPSIWRCKRVTLLWSAFWRLNLISIAGTPGVSHPWNWHCREGLRTSWTSCRGTWWPRCDLGSLYPGREPRGVLYQKRGEETLSLLVSPARCRSRGGAPVLVFGVCGYLGDVSHLFFSLLLVCWTEKGSCRPQPPKRFSFFCASGCRGLRQDPRAERLRVKSSPPGSLEPGDLGWLCSET